MPEFIQWQSWDPNPDILVYRVHMHNHNAILPFSYLR